MSGLLTGIRALSTRFGVPSGWRKPAEKALSTNAQHSVRAWADELDRDMLFPSLSGRAAWRTPIS